MGLRFLLLLVHVGTVATQDLLALDTSMGGRIFLAVLAGHPALFDRPHQRFVKPSRSRRMKLGGNFVA
jgi:hypothetical protein